MSSPGDSGESPLGLAAFAVIGLGACCGIPLLLAAGATVTVAGIGISSWALVLAGLSVALFGVIWNRRRHQATPCDAKESVDAH